jgi:sentrin-specific protease 1
MCVLIYLIQEQTEAIDKLQQNDSTVLVTVDELVIREKDLYTLQSGRWLNDEIIDVYYRLIVQRSMEDLNLPKIFAFPTQFSGSLFSKGYNGVKHWTKKVRQN